MGSIDAPSVLLAAARWLTSLCVILIAGAAGASGVVTRAGGVAIPRDLWLHRIVRRGTAAAALLLVSFVALLGAQGFAWFGRDAFATAEPLTTLVIGTRWGEHWSCSAGGAALAAGLGWLARQSPRTRPVALGFAALVAVVLLPLAGHGASHGVAVWFVHSAHLAGASLWLGALAVLAGATWEAWRDDPSGGGVPGAATLRALLAAFSPVALTGAALLVTSGGVLSILSVRPLDAWWTTDYGRTLLAKLALVVLVAALGWRNWRRLGPAANRGDGHGRLRRAVRLELALALGVVLAVTGWLSGLPIPAPF